MKDEKEESKLNVPSGAVPDAMRRFTASVRTPVYLAIMRENEKRLKEDRHYQASVSTIVQDALIQYLKVEE